MKKRNKLETPTICGSGSCTIRGSGSCKDISEGGPGNKNVSVCSKAGLQLKSGSNQTQLFL